MVQYMGGVVVVLGVGVGVGAVVLAVAVGVVVVVIVVVVAASVVVVVQGMARHFICVCFFRRAPQRRCASSAHVGPGHCKERRPTCADALQTTLTAT